VARSADLKAVRLDLPLDLHAQLDVLAKAENLPMALLVRRLVQEHVRSKATVLAAWERFQQASAAAAVPSKPSVRADGPEDASATTPTQSAPIQKKPRRQS
jgi:hypothetical protein